MPRIKISCQVVTTTASAIPAGIVNSQVIGYSGNDKGSILTQLADLSKVAIDCMSDGDMLNIKIERI